ncbi:MAG: hypothetical protein NC453_23335 [Muribaculum sp.]|nr:hypothetical protein [Muribaculum sp.]
MKPQGNGKIAGFCVCIIQYFLVTLQPKSDGIKAYLQGLEFDVLSNSKEELLKHSAFQKACLHMMEANLHHISRPLSSRQATRKGEMKICKNSQILPQFGIQSKNLIL